MPEISDILKSLDDIQWRLSPNNPEMKAHRDRLQLAIDRLGEIAKRARALRGRRFT